MTSITFFLLFIPILAFILLAVNLIFAPHNPYQEKDSAFECGFHSFLGQNRTQFSISFFIFALLFLLFDLEILLVYPYVVSAYTNGIYGLAIMLIFFLVLTLGFAFELGKNALKIDSRQMFSTPKVETEVTVTLISALNLYSRCINIIYKTISRLLKILFYNVPSNSYTFIKYPLKSSLHLNSVYLILIALSNNADMIIRFDINLKIKMSNMFTHFIDKIYIIPPYSGKIFKMSESLSPTNLPGGLNRGSTILQHHYMEDIVYFISHHQHLLVPTFALIASSIYFVAIPYFRYVSINISNISDKLLNFTTNSTNKIINKLPENIYSPVKDYSSNLLDKILGYSKCDYIDSIIRHTNTNAQVFMYHNPNYTPPGATDTFFSAQLVVAEWIRNARVLIENFIHASEIWRGRGITITNPNNEGLVMEVQADSGSTEQELEYTLTDIRNLDHEINVLLANIHDSIIAINTYTIHMNITDRIRVQSGLRNLGTVWTELMQEYEFYADRDDNDVNEGANRAYFNIFGTNINHYNRNNG